MLVVNESELCGLCFFFLWPWGCCINTTRSRPWKEVLVEKRIHSTWLFSENIECFVQLVLDIRTQSVLELSECDFFFFAALTCRVSPMWRWDFCLFSQSCLRWRITSSFSSWSDPGFSLCRHRYTNAPKSGREWQAQQRWSRKSCKCVTNSLIRKAAVPQERRTLPALAQKSQPAHCQSAGRDIFEWLALLSVGRDLETEQEITMFSYLALTLRDRLCINIFMSDSVHTAHLQSSRRACAGHAWGRLHRAGSGSYCFVRLLRWRMPASGSASPHPPDTQSQMRSLYAQLNTKSHLCSKQVNVSTSMNYMNITPLPQCITLANISLHANRQNNTRVLISNVYKLWHLSGLSTG